MANFDHITEKQFRESLETDYAEMRRCAAAEAWKSVQVIAGSIVEALLVNYLVENKQSATTSKDPLKLDLAEAITICRTQKVISERTADLCSVVRSYRNLIHPGRMVRLNEPAPDKGSATIALALIDMITEDLAKVLRASVGLTGEQIISKIQRDANSLTILKHIIEEASEFQRERLLLELIPSAYQAAYKEDDSYDEYFAERVAVAERLAAGYRIILLTVSPAIRTRVASEFVRILKEEDGTQVLSYGDAFFKPEDIKFVPPQNQAMVREHLLGRISGTHSIDSLKQIDGIAQHLAPPDVIKWLDPYIRTIVSPTIKQTTKDRAWGQLTTETFFLINTEVEERIMKRLDDWIAHFEKEKSTDKAEIIAKLKSEIQPAP